jgi:CheY-like chemotaxis protein
MSHAFDGHQFSQLVTRLEQLVTGARDLERRLVDLVESMEGLPPAPGPPRTADWLPSVRRLCVDSREQRLGAEAILSQLIGDRGSDAGREATRGRVLIVDDVEDNRELLAACLQHAGYETVTASNGLEALIVAHFALPSVVVMDITMPVLDGIDAARLLKASAVTQHLNVIAHTAKPQFLEGPLQRLFVDVVAKPAMPDVVLASIERFAEPSPRKGT